jgi:hypothetical protein
MVLATTLETHLVVSGIKHASLRETSTRERYSKPKYDNHETCFKCGYYNYVAKK